MNSNAFHNFLNVLFLIAGVLVAADWSMFGFDSATMAKITGGAMIVQNVLKIVVNITRDGVTGLVKPQPPVKQ